ncbi:hypothetical protein SAMN04488057_11331 [Cyclobacterium lianum]|uniref:Uncharacterized protein n=1 Tax=Cyclobacterium lianum TaxID=388280 RepID=A0A1M7Q218_9BACT|nr:hypothetical protein [Cyclobacterium lianum]SHN24154.1 hypothetical protein SAMN04488057_11331 [Cyclobacterium lianum]
MIQNQATPVNYFLIPFILISILFSCSSPPLFPQSDADEGSLKFPDGFGGLAIADSIGKGRHLAVSSNGDIYVKLRYGQGHDSNIALRGMTTAGPTAMMTKCREERYGRRDPG